MTPELIDLSTTRDTLTHALREQTRGFWRRMIMCMVLSVANLALACLAVVRLTQPDSWHWLAWACVALNAYGCYTITNVARVLWHMWRFERTALRDMLLRIECELMRIGGEV